MSAKITAIQPQQRNRDRVNISLDGQYAFSLARLTAAWLKLGQELSADHIQELLNKDEVETAYNRALHYLSFRARSSAELERYLQQKEYQASVIDAVLERLQEQGFLDDLRFAQDWIENRNTFRPRSRRALRVELLRKGLPTHIIEEALDKSLPDERAGILQAGLKLGKKYRALPNEEFRKKLAAALLRRGYKYADVVEALPQIWAALVHDPSTDKL